MSSKRVLRKNACAGKVRYRSVRAANDAITEMRRRGKDIQHLNVYRCPIVVPNHPRHFHVGHDVRADSVKLR